MAHKTLSDTQQKEMQVMVLDNVAPQDIATYFGVGITTVHNYKKRFKKAGLKFGDITGSRPVGGEETLNKYTELFSNESVDDILNVKLGKRKKRTVKPAIVIPTLESLRKEPTEPRAQSPLFPMELIDDTEKRDKFLAPTFEDLEAKHDPSNDFEVILNGVKIHIDQAKVKTVDISNNRIEVNY